MKIKTRLYLSACVTIGLIALLIAFSLFFSSGMKKQMEKNRFASELSRKIAELVLVTDEYLAYHYERSAQQWEMKYEEISKMVRNEQSDSFRHLQADLESLRGSFLSMESAAQKRYQLGNNDSGKEVKHISILEERLAGRIRLISNKIMADAFNISQNTLTQIKDLERKDNAIALAVALLLVCLISASSYFTIRKITRPLRGLVESAAIIEKGNFEHQMGVQNLNQDGRPRDEIGELSVSFESMTRKLTQSIEDLQTEVLERKRAEEALRAALAETQLLRKALDEVSAHVYMKDPQFRYIYANRLTLELFGCSAEELVGRDDTHFFPLDTVKRLREVDLRVFAGEQTSEEIDVASVGSERRVYWELKTPIYEGPGHKTISGLLGISTDITERKRIEEALRVSNALLSSILESPRSIIIFSIDKDIAVRLTFLNVS